MMMEKEQTPRILFLFLDGVGLGDSNPAVNPFVTAEMPNLRCLLNDQPLTRAAAPKEDHLASLLALDACLGISGAPQSATGQAVLLTGVNIPHKLGYHYGPKPNPDVASYLKNGNVFKKVQDARLQARFLNAYPARYFEHIQSGRRIYSAIPMAVTSAGLPLLTQDDLFQGEALSADFSGQGWRDQLGIMDTPLLTLFEAGKRLANLASRYHFSLFEFWLSDYAGHRRDWQEATSLLQSFDQVLGGLLDAWDQETGLVLITSDHGNLEDLSVRGHTLNPVPALLIGDRKLRSRFSAGLTDLTRVTPAILDFLGIQDGQQSNQAERRTDVRN